MKDGLSSSLISCVKHAKTLENVKILESFWLAYLGTDKYQFRTTTQCPHNSQVSTSKNLLELFVVFQQVRQALLSLWKVKVKVWVPNNVLYIGPQQQKERLLSTRFRYQGSYNCNALISFGKLILFCGPTKLHFIMWHTVSNQYKKSSKLQEEHHLLQVRLISKTSGVKDPTYVTVAARKCKSDVLS